MNQRQMVDVIVDGERAVYVPFAKRKGGFLISPEDVALIEAYPWTRHGPYIGRKIDHFLWKDLHREIMGFPEGKEVDHRNLNKMDNRRSNLRLATRSQNAHNMALKRSAKMPFKGLEQASNENQTKRWRAKLCVDGKRHRSQYFATPEEAAQAYTELAEQHYGEFAKATI